MNMIYQENENTFIKNDVLLINFLKAKKKTISIETKKQYGFKRIIKYISYLYYF